MADSTRLQLPLIAAAQAQKHITHNEAILQLDGLVQMTALSYTTSAQPGSPSDGDLYLLPAGKTGADWGGYSNHAVAHYYDGVWHQYHPNTGWLCWVQDTKILYYYDGAQWTRVSFGVDARPSFSADLRTTASNVTGDGTEYTITGWTETADNGSNLNASTGFFTAPVAGLYSFSFTVTFSSLGSATEVYTRLVCSGGRDYFGAFKKANGSGGIERLSSAAIVQLAAAETVSVKAAASGTTKTVAIASNATHAVTAFGGHIIA